VAEPPSPTPTIGAHQVVVVGADEQDDVALDVERWTELARAVLLAEGVTGELTVTFVDREEIAALNVEHMGTPGPTDVLSFPLDAGDGVGAAQPGVPVLLGDVVVCPAVAADQAAEHAGTLDDELALLVVHGVLHVLGHDHADPSEVTAMRWRERELLERHHWAGPAPAGFRQHHAGDEGDR
jgi:probable rRNA maturation factor